jgi:hypothetical protein
VQIAQTCDIRLTFDFLHRTGVSPDAVYLYRTRTCAEGLKKTSETHSSESDELCVYGKRKRFARIVGSLAKPNGIRNI